MNVTTNIPHYPEWQAYLKSRQPRAVILWGQNDPVFSPAAPEIIKQALPAARVHYFDGGHFVLDEYAEPIAAAIIETFCRNEINAVINQGEGE